MKYNLKSIFFFKFLISYVIGSIIYSDSNNSNIKYGTDIQLKTFVIESEIQTSDLIIKKTISFSSSFTNVPSVLIGIKVYDNFYNQFFINFQILKATVTTKKFDLQLTVFKDTCLYGITLNYIAIDTVNLKNFYISDIIQKSVTMELSGEFYQASFYIQFQKPSTSQIQKKIQVFLTGFQTQHQNSSYSMDKFSIYLKVISQDTNGFTVQVKQQPGTLLLELVRFNYLEVDEDPYGIIETNLLNYTEYEDATQTNCLYNENSSSQCGKITSDQERYQTSNFRLPHQFTQATLNVVNIFAGLNTFTVNVFTGGNIQTQFNPRLKIIDYSYINSDTAQIKFMTWYYTKVSSIVANGLLILTKSCSDPNTEILNKDKCITLLDQCDIGTYLNGRICAQCDISCATCSGGLSTNCSSCPTDKYLQNDVKSCLDTQPAGYYCQKINSNNYYDCNKCADSNCDTCSSQNLNSCTGCQSGYYRYKGSCLQVAPQKTYCDGSKVCADCTDSNCTDCTSTSVDVCIACDSTKQIYTYLGQCYLAQPSSTYCDPQTLICQSCNVSLCQICLSSLTQCQTCLPQKYLLEKVCYETQPEQATCTGYTCNMSGECLTRDSTNKCIECKSGNYFYKNVCYLVQPSNTCCDSSNSCIDSSIDSCQYCSIEASVSKCNRCKTDYYKYNNSCTKQKPSNTYCDSQKICSQCPSTLGKCLQCNDPIKEVSCLECEANYIIDNGQCVSLTSDSEDCHYSCSQCSGNAYNKCQSCSSNTRQLDKATQTCPCKSGFTDVAQTSECWEDDLDVNQVVKQLGTFGLQTFFILSLPLVAANFHPFTDAYMFPFQLIGNFAIISSKFRKLLGEFTIFNYLNIIFDKEESVQSEEQAVLFGFLEFNSKYSSQVAKDLLFFAIFFLTIIILALIMKLSARNKVEFQQTSSYKYFFWNIFIKSYRVFSSYILIQIFGRLFTPSLLSSQSPISSIIYTLFIILIITFILVGYFFVARKDQHTQQQTQASYLNKNLIIQNNTFHKHFWLTLEVRKILIALFISSMDVKISIFFVITFSFTMTIIFINCKPYRVDQKDCIYLIINEIAIVVFSIVILTYAFRSTEQQLSYINYKNAILILTFIFVCFHLFINFEYFIRLLIQRKRDIRNKKSPNSNTLDISVQELGNTWLQNKLKRSTILSATK